MADTNRISIAETDAANVRAPRVVIVGGGSAVWLRQKPFAKHRSRSFLLIGQTIISFSRFFIR